MQRKAFVVFTVIAMFIACTLYIAINRSWVSGKPGTEALPSDTILGAEAGINDINTENSAVTGNSIFSEAVQGNAPADEAQPAVSEVTNIDDTVGLVIIPGPSQTCNTTTAGNQAVTRETTTAGNKTVTSETTTADSQAVRTIKTFYGYLSSEEDYIKGINLLDDKFVIELELMKQFGIDSLEKSDIDINQTTTYSDILKATKFESLVSEEKHENQYIVYYYQEIKTEQNQLKQALRAELANKGGKWSILSIKECNNNEKPFTY